MDKKKLNILYISPNFYYTCGRSYYFNLLLKYFRRFGHNVVFITNGGDSLERLKENNIKYYILPDLDKKKPSIYLKNIKKISNIIVDNGIQIVHSNHRYTEKIALSAIKRTKKKNVLSVITVLSILKRRYYIEYKSDILVAVSNAVKDNLEKIFKVQDSKIKVIPNFADTEELDNSLDLSMYKYTNVWQDSTTKQLKILSAGRFHEEKNFETILKALKIIKTTNENSQIQNINLLLIGEGPEQKKYEKLIDELNINVKILSPQKSLGGFIRNSDVCILPSIIEPFPNFMLQCGLFKKPFIGSNVDGIKELIINEKNGLLFEAGNKSELAEKIILFTKNIKLREKCGENLHKEIINKYTEKTVIPKIEKLYYEYLK